MSSLPPPIVGAIQFEKSNEVNGSVLEDKFYRAPSGTAEVDPGTLLKVEDVDTSKYLLPPATAMSRFVYQTETLNGSKVPTSAFVLWPYSPKSLEGGYPVVAWAHGTTGIFANAAPSGQKNLWQHFLAPYQLVGQGYVVVAPDYAGLGVCQTEAGKAIVHEYMSGPSQANDIVYAVKAAQEAFQELSSNFVVIGHSQGGGAAWATAERQSVKPVSGYLGAAAISPMTSTLNQPEPFRSVIMTALCPGLAYVYPDFRPSTLLTQEGQQRLRIIEESGGCIASGMALLMGANILHPAWDQNPYVQSYHARISNGGKPIKGPLLVIHGESDDRISSKSAIESANATAELYPSSQLELVVIPNVTHVPALQASQRLWMEWIADRFAGREAESGYKHTKLSPARPSASYQSEQNWYIAPATDFYHAP